MPIEIMVAFIGLAGSGLGTFAGIVASSKLTNYRIGQLEKKVDKHNTVIERTFRLEEQIKVANHRIADLEEKGD
jgi:ABC-type lipoprotein release transport system permease subunit